MEEFQPASKPVGVTQEMIPQALCIAPKLGQERLLRSLGSVVEGVATPIE